MSTDSQEYDVFLSHSSQDKDFVRALDKRLRALGIKTFFDERNVPWGGNIPVAVENAVQHSRYLIVVLSKNAVASEWVDLERCIGVFRSPGGREKHILPLLREQCDVPPSLSILRYLSVRTDLEFQSAWPQIVEHLSELVKQPKRKTIGVACPLFGASQVFYTELLAEIMDRARVYGYDLLVIPIADTAFKRLLISHFPALHALSGLIMITCQVDNSTWLDECAAEGLPVVLLHDNISEEKARGKTVVSYIWPRLEALTELVNVLVRRHQCANFSVVMVSPESHAIRTKKLELITNAMRDCGIDFTNDRQLFFVKDYSHDQGVSVAERILETNPTTDAVVCLSDTTAVGVLHSLMERGIDSSIRVTGFSDVGLAAQNDLTTVSQHLQLTAERAVVELHNSIRSGSCDEFGEVCLIPTTLIERGTTRLR